MNIEINAKEILEFGWSRIFENSEHLALDIGADDGRFSISIAKMFPSENLIAIEIDKHRAKKAVRNVEKEQLKNVKVLKTDVFDALPLLFSRESVSKVFINHPDPWSKRKQWKNRIINPYIFAEIHRILKPDGMIFITSDVVERIEDAMFLASEMSIFQFEFCDEPPEWYPKTRYREEAESLGRKSLFLQLRKRNL